MSYSTTDLLAAIARRSFAPESQVTFTAADMLAMADEEIQTLIAPEILQVREEHFVTSVDYAITANQTAYDIPVRSIGLQVRDVHLVDGNAVKPDFPRVEPESITTAATGNPQGFYLKANAVCLYPTPSSTQKTLRILFPLRHSRLVPESEAAVITAINGNVVTVSTIPADWVTGDVFDLIRQDGGQECVAIDQTASLVSGSDITFDSLPSTLRVGDYVSLADTTPLVQLPPEYRAVLAQAVAAAILDATSQPGADKAKKRLQEMLEAARKLMSPRTVGEQRVMAPNTWGI